MNAPSGGQSALTDIEYKLLLVSYVHAQPAESLNKGRLISTLFAAAGPVGNNPASLPQLLEGLGVDSIQGLEGKVNDFALGAKRELLSALKKTRTSVLNALPPDFAADSREQADIQVKPILGSVARKVQALQEAARVAQAAAEEAAEAASVPVEPPKAPVQVRAMIWQPPISASCIVKLGGPDSQQLLLADTFDGDLVLGAGALLYRLRVQGDSVLVEHYEMYGEHRPGQDAAFPIGHRFVIGRGVKADHRRPEQEADPGSRGLSRMHVAVTVQRQVTGTLAFQLEDLGSTNGTPVWWNPPRLAAPAPTVRQAVLRRATGRQRLDEPIGGEAWLAVGSMWCRLTVQGAMVRVAHLSLAEHQPIDEGLVGQHVVGDGFTIGRDPAAEHPVPKEHPGAVGLSRRHATVRVAADGSGLHLVVEDHSSNGTTVCWDPPAAG